MVSKEHLVHNLGNLKLVIGNGFDLHCKLKTKYSDFFISCRNKNEYFGEWIKMFTPNARNYIDFHNPTSTSFWTEFARFDEINVWDLYFYLVSKDSKKKLENWRWCDIELKIEESLLDLTEKPYLGWLNVYDLLTNNVAVDNWDFNYVILSSVVYKKNGEKSFRSEEEFFAFLYDQLKIFEHNFGQYIKNLHYIDSSPMRPNTTFRLYASMTINYLCNIKKLVSIDSFNYDFIDIKEFEPIFHNINGNCDFPIFGIDSNRFSYKDYRHIFSKTNRRMELDMFEEETNDPADFENIVIFGHSLNEADYSYFFSLFDKIDIINLEKSSKVVFAFSIYDGKTPVEIRADLRKSIFRLFQDYSKYKGNSEFPNRLLDALTTQNKVLIYEIPKIDV